jgi:hypothetical protein
MKSPSSQEQVWTLLYTPNKFPSASSDIEECSPENLRRNELRRSRCAKPQIPVPITRRVPVAVGTAAIDRRVVPGASTLHSESLFPLHPLARARKMDTFLLCQKNGVAQQKDDCNFFHEPEHPLLLPLPARGEGVGGWGSSRNCATPENRLFATPF